MIDFVFTPLHAEMNVAVGRIPTRQLNKYFDRGLEELSTAISTNLQGTEVPQESAYLGKKWFGSENYLRKFLIKILSRLESPETDLTNFILPNRLELLDKLAALESDGSRTPSWVLNQSSRDLQLYQLYANETYERLRQRYIREGRSNSFRSMTVPEIYGFWSRRQFTALYTHIYTVSYGSFIRRSSLGNIYPNWHFDDEITSRYTKPRACASSQYNALVIRRFNIINNNTPSDRRPAWTERAPEWPAEEQRPVLRPVNGGFIAQADTTATEIGW